MQKELHNEIVKDQPKRHLNLNMKNQVEVSPKK